MERDDPGARIPPKPVWAAALWLAACGVIVFVRLRVHLNAYVDLYRDLASEGVPTWALKLDYPLIMLGPALLGAALAWMGARDKRGDGPFGLLLLRSPLRGWLPVTLIASAPMVIGGAVLMLSRGARPVGGAFWSDVLLVVVRAPIVEEGFFRGFMVALPAALLAGGAAWALRGRRFWVLAAVSALVFGSLHIELSVGGLAGGWLTLLVTAAGGVWFAWLMRSWRSVLVPLVLHAGMNLGWVLMDAEGGAGGGGLLENLLRAATIAAGTLLTIRANRRDPKGREGHGNAEGR